MVGAGPAGLSCAHRLARHGHDVTVFEARPKPGGLNEYGIAAYKVPDDFAQREVDWLLSIGGIAIRHDQRLGRDVDLARLRREFDAVFLGLGQSGVRALGLVGETLGGVRERRRFHRGVAAGAGQGARRGRAARGGDRRRQHRDRRGDTVAPARRRGRHHRLSPRPGEMSATHHEQEWAQTNGVRIRHHAAPHRLLAEAGMSAASSSCARNSTRPGVPCRPARRLRSPPTWC